MKINNRLLLQVFVFAVISTNFAFGQNKSDYNLGLSFGAIQNESRRIFNSNELVITKTRSYQSSLFFNYFFKDNFSIGLNFGIKKYFSDNNPSNDFLIYYAPKKQIHLLNFGFNPRYYIPLSKNFYIPIELQVNFVAGSGIEDILIPENLRRVEKNVYRGFVAKFNPGISYLLSNKMEFNLTFSLISLMQLNSYSELISSNQIKTQSFQIGYFANHH